MLMTMMNGHYMLESRLTEKTRIELGSVTLFWIVCSFLISICVAGKNGCTDELAFTLMIIPIIYLPVILVINAILVNVTDIIQPNYIIFLFWFIVTCIHSVVYLIIHRKFGKDDGFIFWPWKCRSVKEMLLILAPDYYCGSGVIILLNTR